MLGSGNLGLVYLMDEPRRMTLEEIDARHPEARPGAAGATRTSAGCSSARRSAGRVVLGGGGSRELATGRIEGDDPLAHFGGNAPAHLLRSDSFEHVPDILVGSFYDPSLQDACAFEELMSFHGGLGGPQDPAVHLRARRPAGAGRPARRRGVRPQAARELAHPAERGRGGEREPAPERAAGVPA